MLGEKSLTVKDSKYVDIPVVLHWKWGEIYNVFHDVTHAAIEGGSGETLLVWSWY